jgi:hypothetical protein
MLPGAPWTVIDPLVIALPLPFIVMIVMQYTCKPAAPQAMSTG